MKKLPDEAMHIAGTMLFGGFCSVVGTMWTIYDEDAPFVADIFYKHLFSKGSGVGVDVTNTAQALHIATKELQKKGVPCQRWAPFIHLGL